MKKNQITISLFLIFFLFNSYSFSQEKMDLEIIAKIREEGFQRSQVMDMASYISDVYGNRLIGSMGMKKAQKWAKEKMDEIGLQNTKIEFAMEHGVSWDMEYVSIHMLEPDYYPLTAFPLAYSPGINGKIVKQAMIVNIQTEDDFEKFQGKVKDAIVLISPLLAIDPAAPIVTNRRTEKDLLKLSQDLVTPPTKREPRISNPNLVSSVERINFLKSEGAAFALECRSGRIGVVRTFARPGVKQERWSKDGMLNSIPVVSMVPEHYNRIYRLLERGIPVKLEADIRVNIGGKTEVRNVLGEIPGIDLKDELVMIGAHFDSWHTSPGATDNICGSSVMLEAMRILKTIDVKPRRTIRIALWGGEEDGINGSREYVKAQFGDPKTGIKPDYNKFSVYFNMDNSKGQFVGINMQANEKVRSIFAAWFKPLTDLGLTTLSIKNTGSTDHIPFDQAGLPGFQFIQDRFGQGSGHTNIDFYETLGAEDLMKNAVIIASFAYQAAMRDEIFPRKTVE